MMKRGMKFIFLSLMLVLLLSFVSAGVFSNFWNKITGEVVSEDFISPTLNSSLSSVNSSSSSSGGLVSDSDSLESDSTSDEQSELPQESISTFSLIMNNKKISFLVGAILVVVMLIFLVGFSIKKNSKKKEDEKREKPILEVKKITPFFGARTINPANKIGGNRLFNSKPLEVKNESGINPSIPVEPKKGNQSQESQKIIDDLKKLAEGKLD